MLFRPSKDLTVVLFEDQKPAKCFKLNKTKINSFLIFIPLLAFISMATTMGVFSYFKELKNSVKSEQPEALQEFKEKIALLNQNLNVVEKENSDLLNKIQSGSAANINEAIPLFRQTVGFKNLTSQNLISVEGLETEINANQVKFSFNLVNPSQGAKRVSGHIVVLQRNSGQINLYPATGPEGFPILYSRGETFTVSRFRPVEAVFTRPQNKQQGLFFEIYIFDKKGDLLSLKRHGPIGNI